MENIPLIIQVAAWAYVIKQFFPLLLLPIVLGGGYLFLRVTGTSHKRAMEVIVEGIKEGFEDFNSNY